MTKSEEIELRHKYEAICRHAGVDVSITALGKYKDPLVQLRWIEVKERGEA